MRACISSGSISYILRLRRTSYRKRASMHMFLRASIKCYAYYYIKRILHTYGYRDNQNNTVYLANYTATVATYRQRQNSTPRIPRACNQPSLAGIRIGRRKVCKVRLHTTLYKCLAPNNSGALENGKVKDYSLTGNYFVLVPKTHSASRFYLQTIFTNSLFTIVNPHHH